MAELEAKARQQKSAPEAPTGEKAQAAPDVGAISLDVDPVVGAVASPGPDVAPGTSVLPPHLTPYTLHPQPSTPNPQPSTLNPQPATLNPQPSTLNHQPSTRNPQPSTLNPPNGDDGLQIRNNPDLTILNNPHANSPSDPTLR